MAARLEVSEIIGGSRQRRREKVKKSAALRITDWADHREGLGGERNESEMKEMRKGGGEVLQFCGAITKVQNT